MQSLLSVADFGVNHPSEQSSSNLRARVSSDRELIERERRIAPTLEGYLEGELEYKCVKSLTKGFACYSHMIAILCDIDIQLLSIGRLERSCKCQSDAMVRFIELEDMKECQMCLEHGIQGTSRVGMLEYCNLRLLARDCQTTHPCMYLDKCLTMPSVIATQLESLLEEFDYNVIRSVCKNTVTMRSHLFTEATHPEGYEVTPVRELRQCICIGAVNLGHYTVVLWMIRPTINYLECMISCSSEEDRVNFKSLMFEELSNMRHIPRQLKGISINEKRIDDRIELHVTGDGCLFLADSTALTRLGMRVSVVAIGSSSVNVTALNKGCLGVEIIPMITDSGLVRSITSLEAQSVEGMDIVPEGNKVTVKFVRVVNRTATGPVLIIGKNGGFQWVGSPSMICSTLAKFFRHAAYRMTTEEFRTSVKVAHKGVRKSYISGVSRRQKS